MSYSFISDDTRHRVNAFASFMKVQRESYYGGGEMLVSDFLEKAKTSPLTTEESKEMNKRLVSYGRTKGYTGVLGAQYAYRTLPACSSCPHNSPWAWNTTTTIW